MHLFFFTYLFGIVSADLIVHTNSGPISGVPSLSKNVDAFLGIPYAEPPIGELRFGKPVPKRKWSKIYNASHLPPPCTQHKLDTDYYFMPEVLNMSENCLYLNIWSPKSMYSTDLKPVVIFIHPGLFLSGSTNFKVHDGSHLANHGNLVVASINYRLGAFGYLLAYIDEANGNMGMYDQVLAIKWIKENARHFGGDPENIILMGSSAGACSVSAHIISPLSRNLFKRAIVQSGSAFHPFLRDNNERLYRNSQKIASLVGCENQTMTLKRDPRAVVKCLKSKPEENFAAAEKYLTKENLVIFYPRMDDEFLPKNDITDFFRKGKFRNDIEVLTGITEEEGTLLLMLALPEYFGNYGRNNENKVNKFRAFALGKGILLAMEQTKTLEITNSYLKEANNRSSDEYTKTVANILGDFSITCSTIFLADFLSLYGNSVYFYKFQFRSPSAPMEEWIGTTHLDELQYIFGNPYHNNFTDEEIRLSYHLIHRWSSFARTGNPNVPGFTPWFHYSYQIPLYLNFGQEEESLSLSPNDRCEIWRERFNAHIDSE